MTTVYAFLSHQPCQTLINFAEKLFDRHNMDVYIIVDNKQLYKSDKIYFIQISEKDSLWEKALYYFGNVHSLYDFVWLITEDVFVSSDSALKNINDTYREYDLLIPEDDCLPIPPACRISKSLMQYIKNSETLDQIKYVALNNKLSVHYPMELSTIKKRARWTLNDIKRKKSHLYYPIGNYEEHEIYRHYEPDNSYMLY